MKKVSVIFFAAMLMSSLGAFGNKGNTVNPKQNLSTQIYELIKENSFDVESNELTATIRFTVNRKGELVVLSVETEEDVLEGFLKSRLNYKKVELQATTEGRIYTIPVRFTA